MMLLVFVLLWLTLAHVHSLLTPTRVSHVHFHPRSRSLLKGVESHLIDCSTKEFSDLYGSIDSGLCMNTNMNLFSGIPGIFEQAVTIGFLISMYFFFKKLSTGEMQKAWDEVDINDNNNFDFSKSRSSMDNIRRYNAERLDMQDENDDDDSYYMRCPQCDGVGTFIYPQRASSSSFAAGREGPDSSVEDICDLCDGEGVIQNFNRRRNPAKRLYLPPDE